MDYTTKNHAKFLILYHLIFVCKYRKKLLIPYGNEVKQSFEDIAARSDFAFEALEVDQDHIHCLVKSEPGVPTFLPPVFPAKDSPGRFSLILSPLRTTYFSVSDCTQTQTRIDSSTLEKASSRFQKGVLEGENILE
jgi:hypothetical protein